MRIYKHICMYTCIYTIYIFIYVYIFVDCDNYTNSSSGEICQHPTRTFSLRHVINNRNTTHGGATPILHAGAEVVCDTPQINHCHTIAPRDTRSYA